MALEEGQGRVRVTARYRDEFDDEVLAYDQLQQVAQMCSVRTKLKPKKNPLPSFSSSSSSSSPTAAPKKTPRKPEKEPLEENSFLIPVDENENGLHGKVVARLRGKGYIVTKGSSRA